MTRRQPRLYCSDWSCPSMWGCERAWARAEEYWAFDVADIDEGRVATRVFERRRGVDSCDDYERATPKDWLKTVFTPQGRSVIEPPPRGFALYAIRGGRA
ncbi:MAG: hypothetical protein LCH57_01855 [Proteobacteria bacterium]|nr:hypothetical protein [Pseudomonadota bacterium]